MDLNVTKMGFRHLSEFMTRRGINHTATTGHIIPRPIPTRQAFLDTWKKMANPLELQPPHLYSTWGYVPGAGGIWTQLSIGLLNHSKPGRTPAYWSLGSPCAATKTWPRWPRFGPRTFRSLALLCSIEIGLASRRSYSRAAPYRAIPRFASTCP